METRRQSQKYEEVVDPIMRFHAATRVQLSSMGILARQLTLRKKSTSKILPVDRVGSFTEITACNHPGHKGWH